MWQNGVYLLNGNGEFSDKYSTMPTASIGLVGKIVQYTGTTTVNYINGYFYKGIATNMPSVATIGIGESTGITEATLVKATFEGLITASGTYDFVFSASTATSDIGTSTGITASSVVVATFETLLTATGDYVFTFDGTDWKYDSSAVTLSDYGISVTGTPNENDTVTVSYVKADWKYDGDIVTLSDYGITAVGTPDDQDTISVVYAVAYVTYSWSNINVQAGSQAGSGIPFAVKSSNVDSNGLTDIASISEILNVGCSATAGVATGGSGKYLQLLQTAPFGTADSWEIKTKYTYATGSGGTVFSVIGGTTEGISLAINPANEKFGLSLSSNGTSQNIYGAETTLVAVNGTSYWFKITYSSTTGYELLYNTDGGVSYTSLATSATTTKLYSKISLVFLNSLIDKTSYFSLGTIDLNATTLTFDSVLWWSYSETISFKIDDGTSYAPLTIVSADGTETTLETVADLDLSSLSTGRINIFFGASGAVAYNNTIFNQTNQPTALATNDIWFNNLDEAKKWSGSAWVATDLVFGLYIIKNGVLETYCNVPSNYNGIGEMLVKSYNLTTSNYDIYIRPNFKFYCLQSGETLALDGININGANDCIVSLLVLMADTNYGVLTSTAGDYSVSFVRIGRNSIKLNTVTSYNNGLTYWEVKGYVAK